MMQTRYERVQGHAPTSEQKHLERHLDLSRSKTLEYRRHIRELAALPKGGFEHGDIAGMYVAHQTGRRWGAARHTGWKNLLDIVLSPVTDITPQVVVDFLAGSGTLARHARKLFVDHTFDVIGIDVSEEMCSHARACGEFVMWGSHRAHTVKHGVADVAVAAYGFHHVANAERAAFVANMSDVLHAQGRCVLHDFAEGSATARWYSEIIHRYRVGGHDFAHFQPETFVQILAPYFQQVDVRRVYDPFYVQALPGQSDEALLREFFAYLIGFFSLSKLLPRNCSYERLVQHTDASFWQHVHAVLAPCFSLSTCEREAVASAPQTVPVVNALTLLDMPGGHRALVAPRIALVGVGQGRREMDGPT